MSYGNSPVSSHRRNNPREDYRSRYRSNDIPRDYDDHNGRGGYAEDRFRRRDVDYGRSGGNRYAREYDAPDHRPSRYLSRSDGGFPVNDRPRAAGFNSSGSKPSRVIGVFGLSTRTEERHLYDVLSTYGPLEDIQIVYDSLTGRSRGFAFVYFENLEDARSARSACSRGLELHGRILRVDFSVTSGPHQPTPGIYMGKDKRRFEGGGRRAGYGERRPFRSRSPVSPARKRYAGNIPEGPVRRRSRVVSSSRSRSPPPVFSPRRHGGRSNVMPSRSPSGHEVEENDRYASEAKNLRAWSDHSVSVE